MSNPFAPDPNQAPAATSPFASSTSQGNLRGGFDLPPCPVGVLRGHTTELKQYPKGFMLYVVCDDPTYPSKEAAGIWIGTDTVMLKQIAGGLGLTIESSAGKFRVVDEHGKRDAEAFKNKPGLFVYAPYNGGPSINKFGLPKKGSSPEWDQYVEERTDPFTEDQIKALKRARGGVVPSDSTHLFE